MLALGNHDMIDLMGGKSQRLVHHRLVTDGARALDAA